MGSTDEMIDLHCHIIPGLDDGPKTMEESIQMCRVAFQDGIRTIVATPHTLNGLYQNDKSIILKRIDALCSELRTRNSELSLRILPGSDIHLSETTLEKIDQGEAMTIGNAGKYILVEFTPYSIPFQAERILFQLLARGITPIISHPERNLEIGTRPGRYYEMIKMGCLGQVTAMSLTGDFGPKIRQWAERFLKHRLIHLIASDAHSNEGRKPLLSSAVRVAAKVIGKDEAIRMVTDYPRAILEGRRPDLPDPKTF